MAEQRVQRRLAAILAADVVGYSRLMRADETRTLARFNELLDNVVRPALAEHRGRLVKTMGDGFLVEIASVVDAVQCAADIQAGTSARAAGETEDRRMQLRVGVHLGDVIVEGDDIHGDGVNIAARLEGLAEPGGIVVSGKVHEEVRGKVEVDFEDLGPQSVKNISDPVRCYRVKVDAEAAREPADNFGLEIRDRPSIAVLPFANMSGDPEQEYFADGVAEDVITALSRFRSFFVVARNSSFAYKGRNVDVRQIGRELEVRYVLEGSVRRGGNRLRLTAQLVEAATGNHLWAERFEGALEDVFDLQDRITEGVVGAIEPSVRLAEIERVRRKRPDSLDAYDLYLRALQHTWDYKPSETENAIAYLDKALRIDPGYAAAHGLAAWFYANITTFVPGYSHGLGSVQKARSLSIEHARAVLGPGTDDSLALAFAAWALAMFERDYDVARDAVGRALTLTPNSPMVLALAALVDAYSGQFDDAIAHAEASLRLSPFDPMRYTAELAVAYGHFFSERHHEAGEAAQRSLHINPRFVPAISLLVASRVRSGDMQAARAAAERLLALYPEFRVGNAVWVGRFTQDLNDKYAAALLEAGLPE